MDILLTIVFIGILIIFDYQFYRPLMSRLKERENNDF